MPDRRRRASDQQRWPEPERLVAVACVPPVEGRTEGLAFMYDGDGLTDEQTAAIRLAVVVGVVRGRAGV